MKSITIRERLICAAICHVDETVTLIPLNELIMDHYNTLYAHDAKRVTGSTFGFVTNHGRFVNEIRAKEIAVEAGQAEKFQFRNKAVSTDIWPEYFNFSKT